MVPRAAILIPVLIALAALPATPASAQPAPSGNAAPVTAPAPTPGSESVSVSAPVTVTAPESVSAPVTVTAPESAPVTVTAPESAPAAAARLAAEIRAYPAGGDRGVLAQLRQRFDEARAQVGEIRIRAGTLFAEVWIDGVRAGYAANGPVFAAPGARAVEVRAPGYLPQRRAIDVTAGAAQDIDVVLILKSPRSPRPPEADEAPAPPPHHGKSAAFMIGGLLSAAMLGALGLSLTMQGSDEQEVMGAVTLGAGGALAAGVGVYALWPEPEPKAASAARAPGSQFVIHGIF